MATFEHAGIDIHFEDTGGDDPPIIWSHGFLMDHTMFDPQVEGLDGYRHIRWDERGFGQTDAPGPFTYWDSADDAVALLDHLGIDSAVFAGMSQGGFLSMRAALAHPDRVRALILIDTESGKEDAETIESYQGMVGAIAHGDDETRSGVFDIVAGLILGDESLTAEWKAKWMAAPPERIIHPGGCLLERDDLGDRVGEITQPALIVHGTEDQAIGLDKAKAMRDALGDCRGLVEVPGAAHAANLTHADVVNPPIAEFLAGL